MFRNYLVTALRNIVRHKLYSFINVCGLTIGLVCAILIILFVRDELSWDSWLPGSADLYRLSTTLNYPGRPPEHFAITSFPLLPAAKESIPEVLAATHIIPEDVTVGVGQNQFYETVQVVDPGFFQVIRLPFVEGTPDGVFAQPNSVVISQSIARKYFGTFDPLGKVIAVSGSVCAAPRTGAASLSGSALFRTSLVVLQFAVSIGLGTAVLVVFAQISFARDVALGFKQDGVVIVDAQNLSASARKSFADALRVNPEIEDAALSDSVPFDDNTIDLDVHAPGGSTTEAFRVLSMSPNYMHLYGVRTLAGRVLSETRQQDARQANGPYNILINASGAHRLGYSITDVIGKTITLHTTPVTVVGVVEDMKMAGPKQQVFDTIFHALLDVGRQFREVVPKLNYSFGRRI